ncbi:MAG: DUF2029 domain-containing protein [Pseudomonadota bacterium]|nr:DUF2029 domain-containing protein [Pseudomonadota bacterium]
MRGQPVATERPPFVFWACLWGLGLSVAIAGVLLDTLIEDNGPLGRDFANLYAAGALALQGQALSAFDVVQFRIAIFELTGERTVQNYSYPPHALLIAIPFALLPYLGSFAVWTLAGAGFFIWAARRWVPFAPHLAILTPAAGLNMWNGHYGFFLGGLWLLFFHFLPRIPRRAGLIAAVLTIKPHMGLFIAVGALSRRPALLWGAIGALVLFAVSASLFGLASWEAFAVNTTATQAQILTRAEDLHYFRLMPTAFAAFGRGDFALVAHLIVVLCTLFMLLRRPTLDPFALATATFLILPYAFSYDMTVACLGFAIILYRDWATLDWWRKAVLSLGFLVPAWIIEAAPMAPLMLLGALWIQLERAGHWKMGLPAEPRASAEPA